MITTTCGSADLIGIGSANARQQHTLWLQEWGWMMNLMMHPYAWIGSADKSNTVAAEAGPMVTTTLLGAGAPSVHSYAPSQPASQAVKHALGPTTGGVAYMKKDVNKIRVPPCSPQPARP